LLCAMELVQAHARCRPVDAAVVGSGLAEELHRVGRANLAGVIDVQAHLEGALVEDALVRGAAAAHVDAPALIRAEYHLLAGHKTAETSAVQGDTCYSSAHDELKSSSHLSPGVGSHRAQGNLDADGG